jgi:hypothetical protein
VALDPLTMALPFILLFAHLFPIRSSMRQRQPHALTKNLKKDDGCSPTRASRVRRHKLRNKGRGGAQVAD